MTSFLKEGGSRRKREPKPIILKQEDRMYPTMEEVEAADRYTLCRWYRFLPSPGWIAIGPSIAQSPNFEEAIVREGKIMDRIVARHKELGGFSPEISKALEGG